MQHDINRYRMKATYQRNMLLANLIVVVVLGVPVALAWFLGSGQPPERQTTHQLAHPIVISDSSVVSDDTTRAARRSIPAFNPYAPRHEGFLGFVDLRPTPAPRVIVAIPQPIAVADPAFSTDDVTTPTSYSMDEGDDTGVFLPGDYSIPEYLPSRADTVRQLVNRPVQLIRSVRPKLPPIAGWDKKEGYVEVLLLIDSTGRQAYYSSHYGSDLDVDGPTFMLDVVTRDQRSVTLQFFVDDATNDLLYVNIKEEPRDYHFARYLTEVLPEWTFSPAIKDSRPVASFVVLQYRYCREADPSCQQILLKSAADDG